MWSSGPCWCARTRLKYSFITKDNRSFSNDNQYTFLCVGRKDMQNQTPGERFTPSTASIPTTYAAAVHSSQMGCGSTSAL